MSTPASVLLIVAKQREEKLERVKLVAERESKELAERQAEQAKRDTEEKRRRAEAALKQAFGSGDDNIAADNSRTVSMELLSQVWEDGYNSLHSAAAQGMVECCRTIMKRKDFLPDMLSVRDKRGWTPLHCAVMSSDNGAEICEFLASHPKCPLGAKDNEGRTPVSMAMEWGLCEAKTAILDAIAIRYAKVRAKDEAKAAEAEEAARIEAEMQESPEEYGSAAGLRLFKEGSIQECLKLVRSTWPFINHLDDDLGRCRSLLHYAAYKGEPDLCEAILDRADWRRTDQMDLDRATALHLAAANRHVECCIAIVASGRCLAVNSQDMRDQTALHLAAVRGDGECYNAILAHEGVDLSVRDFRSKLAAEYAMDRGLEIDMPVIDRLDQRDLPIDDPDLEVDL